MATGETQDSAVDSAAADDADVLSSGMSLIATACNDVSLDTTDVSDDVDAVTKQFHSQ